MQRESIQKIIEQCLLSLGITWSEIGFTTNEGRAMFVLRTPDSRLLIGTGGENLRALNTIVRRLVEKNNGPDTPPFIIDVNGYYRKRIADIKQQAGLLASRARSYKTDVEMEPMNSYERMIVHALFTQESDLWTESRGEGHERHVVIRYRAPEQNTLTADRALFAN